MQGVQDYINYIASLAQPKVETVQEVNQKVICKSTKNLDDYSNLHFWGLAWIDLYHASSMKYK